MAALPRRSVCERVRVLFTLAGYVKVLLVCNLVERVLVLEEQ